MEAVILGCGFLCNVDIVVVGGLVNNEAVYFARY